MNATNGLSEAGLMSSRCLSPKLSTACDARGAAASEVCTLKSPAPPDIPFEDAKNFPISAIGGKTEHTTLNATGGIPREGTKMSL
jgi:hypothetical protein